MLGLGSGWQENEHEQYGIELPPPGERVDRFEEACLVLKGLLREHRKALDSLVQALLTLALCAVLVAPRARERRADVRTAGTLGQRMGDVSGEMIRRNMQAGPTLEVRPGFKFSIYVSQDLVIPPYDHYGDS